MRERILCARLVSDVLEARRDAVANYVTDGGPLQIGEQPLRKGR